MKRRVCTVVERLEGRVMLTAVFLPQVTFGVGNKPTAVAVGDLNRDGKPDLVVGNLASGTLSLLLGKGNGAFVAQRTVAVGAVAQVVVADLNGDGKPDLVVSNGDFRTQTGSTVSVLMGNGDGTFAARRTLGVGLFPYAVSVSDLNGDGKPDLVVTDVKDHGIGVMMGNGDGTFGPQQATQTSANGYPLAMAVGDLNGDGKPDVVVSNPNAYGSSVGVLLGNGDGSLQTEQTFATAYVPTLALGDLNRDGKLDLVYSDYLGHLSELFGQGNGTFAAPVTYSAAGGAPKALIVTDVDHDGLPDVVSVDADESGVSVFRGFGQQGQLNDRVLFGYGANPWAVTAADVSGDGWQDLIFANYSGNSVSVLPGDVPPSVLSIELTAPADPSLGASTLKFTVTFSKPVMGVAPSDFGIYANGFFGHYPVDLQTSAGSTYDVELHNIFDATFSLGVFNDGSITDALGNPLAPKGGVQYDRVEARNLALGPASLATADFNGDGIPDLVTANRVAGNIGVLLGNGPNFAGSFGPQKILPSGATPEWAAVGDLNRDGKQDIVAASGTSTIGVYLGNGNGTFLAPQTFAGQGASKQVAVVDLNGDGKPDVVTADYGGTLSVMLGNGDGTLQARMTFATETNSTAMTLADFNRDGRLDVAVGSNFGDVHWAGVLLGNGNGTFGAMRTFGTGPAPRSISAADLNGDGKIDLVTANYLGGSVSVLAGNGDGTFKAQMTVDPGVSLPRYVVAADASGDGKPDLIVATGTTRDVSILRGNGDFTFDPGKVSIDYFHPTVLLVGDLNRDGKPDVVEAGVQGDSVSVYLNTQDGRFIGPTVTTGVPLETAYGTAGDDVFTLVRDITGDDIDWTVGNLRGVVPLSPEHGLTFLGSGGKDRIVLDYSNGNPLPDTLHLDGTFTIQGLQGSDPLLGKTLEIGRSTVFIEYAGGGSPVEAITRYLGNGYDSGRWDGFATTSSGAITSAAAQGNAQHNTGIGWADSADGTGTNATANTIELKYTLNGDTNLNGLVDIFDLNALLPNFNGGGKVWTGGDSNYSGNVDIFDLNAMLPNFNTLLGNQVQPAVASAANVTSGRDSVGTEAAVYSSRSVTADPAVDGSRRRRRDVSIRSHH